MNDRIFSRLVCKVLSIKSRQFKRLVRINDVYLTGDEHTY